MPQSMNHTSHKIALLEVYELRHLVLRGPHFFFEGLLRLLAITAPAFFGSEFGTPSDI